MINPNLVAWFTNETSYYLLQEKGQLLSDIKLSDKAISFVKQFASATSFNEIHESYRKDEQLLKSAIDANLLIDPEFVRLNKDNNLFDGFRLTDVNKPTEEIFEKITRQFEIMDRRVIVLDNLLRSTSIRNAERWLKGLSYRLADYDTEEESHIRHWIHEFRNPKKIVREIPFLENLLMIIEFLFSDRKLSLERLHANSSLYGDLQLPHKDVEGQEGFTLLYYGNANWTFDWMGETVFYSKEEPTHLVYPKPGRIVIFNGDILHRAGTPSRLCFESRLTLSFKFTVL